ncbi:MAG: acetate CoA-transferase subunit alpha [Clostridiaceae bacterium]|nr:acetate CoA-transferase subunit alpha [Clostridiaceae bacterium]
MNKVVTMAEALSRIKNGQSVMIGGFLTVGTPQGLVDAIVDSEIGELTLIVNDTAFADRGVGKLIACDKVKKVITSHIGTNKITGKKMHAGEIEVELVPQGSLAEKIRSEGAGLGGFLTPTGVGTAVEENKQVMEFDGKKYILERPMGADIALIKAHKADTSGNLVYRRAARNFNPLMAMAADLVIVEADEIVEAGELDPDEVMTPCVFVDLIVRKESPNESA